MSSTTSKRLRRVWGIVESAYETGAMSVSIAYLEAALEGGETWAKLEALANEAPLPPDEYHDHFVTQRDLAEAGEPHEPLTRDPVEYERWYDSEMDRLSAKQEAILRESKLVTQ